MDDTTARPTQPAVSGADRRAVGPADVVRGATGGAPQVSGIAEGYTLLSYAAPGCATPPDVRGPAATLQECVRSSRHGVLVVAGCTLGPVTCRLRAAGPVLVVQPCDRHRRAVGPAIWIGPLRTDPSTTRSTDADGDTDNDPDGSEIDGVLAADLALVVDWLRAARFDPALLPPRLTALHRRTRAVSRN